MQLKGGADERENFHEYRVSFSDHWMSLDELERVLSRSHLDETRASNSRTFRECNRERRTSHLRHDLNALMARSFCDFNYGAVICAVAPLFVSRNTNHHARRVILGNSLVADRDFFFFFFFANIWPRKRISISICWIVTRLIYPRIDVLRLLMRSHIIYANVIICRVFIVHDTNRTVNYK